jgi:hypothetical protein
VEGLPGAVGRDRIVRRLRVRLQSEKNPRLGKELGNTGTDSAMIGVCDIKAFEKAIGPDPGDEVQDAIEAQTDDGYGIIKLKKFRGAVMPFVPTGSDGSGPVFALVSGRKHVGIELPFMEEEAEEQPAEKPKAVKTRSPRTNVIGKDQNTYIKRRLADGSEASFWYGGKQKAGEKFSLWSSAEPGPVEYRIRAATGSTVKEWTLLKKYKDGGATFYGYDKLPPGTYEVDFRVGDEVFSALKLKLQ